MKRRFRVTEAGHFTPCRCGNREEFVAVAERCAEDCCEVWVKCGRCGHDPTEDRWGHRLEDTWGSLDKETIWGAMQCREAALADERGTTLPTPPSAPESP